jgi:hypothetical protein
MESAANTLAWIVPVMTQRIGDFGKPVLVCYAAGAGTAAEAVEAVKKHIGALEGDEVMQPTSMLEKTAKILGVRPGLVWML